MCTYPLHCQDRSTDINYSRDLDWEALSHNADELSKVRSQLQSISAKLGESGSDSLGREERGILEKEFRSLTRLEGKVYSAFIAASAKRQEAFYKQNDLMAAWAQGHTLGMTKVADSILQMPAVGPAAIRAALQAKEKAQQNAATVERQKRKLLDFHKATTQNTAKKAKVSEPKILQVSSQYAWAIKELVTQDGKPVLSSEKLQKLWGAADKKVRLAANGMFFPLILFVVVI